MADGQEFTNIRPIGAQGEFTNIRPIAAPDSHTSSMAPGSFQTHKGGAVIDPTQSPLRAGIDAFMRAWGTDPEKVAAQPTMLGSVAEAGKEAATSFGKGIASEWKQPTVGGMGGESRPLGEKGKWAARALFPAHLAARGIEGMAGAVEGAASDIQAGTPQSIATGIGSVMGTKSQVAAPEALLDATFRPIVSSAGKLLERQVALNKGRVALVNDLKRAGSLLENQVTGENGEVGRHAQAVIAADKADLMRSQSEGKVSTADATLKAQQVLDKTKMGGVAGGYPANMPLDAAKALITQIGREASRLERTGKAPEAAATWAEYDGLRKATQERADALGPQFGKSWKHYINEFSNYIQLKKGVFGNIMEDTDHVGILNKLTKGDVAAQIPEIKDWMKKYGVDSEPLDYAIKQGQKINELVAQTGNMFFGKIRAIMRHPLTAGPAAIGAAEAGRATKLPGMAFVLPLLVAGKVAGLLDQADLTKILKEIQAKTGPEMGRVTPAPEGPQPLPQPPTGSSVATEEDALEEARRRAPGAPPTEPTPQSAKEATDVEAAKRKQATSEAAMGKADVAKKVAEARGSRATSGVYKGKR